MAFQFSSKLSLDIEGKKFEIDTSRESVIRAFQKLADESVALSKEEVSDDNLNENASRMVRICEEFVEQLLGKESFTTIFEGRQVSSEDVVDLTTYLCEEVKKYKEQRLMRFAGKQA